jgi:hypothetical protein
VHRFEDPDDWVRKVVCECGREDGFRVLTTDPFTPVQARDGAEITSGSVRLELECQACNASFTVFDNQLNGWNAVIVDDRSLLPSDYVDRVRDLLVPETCGICQSPRFGCVVLFCYDADPDDLPDDGSKWDEAFGAFVAWSICSHCGRVREVGQAETG